jgi:tetratricopeptide (TPR) repeat protein
LITLVFALLVAGIALSTEAELHIERGRADLGAARVEDARIHALLAFEFDDSSHEAYRLYIDVMLAGGLGPKALTDTNGLVVVDPPYKEAVEQVRVALKAEDPKAAVATVRALQTEWPDRPDLLAVLWEIDLDHGKVAREKARILDFVVDALPKTDDPLYAFRARRLLIEVQADAEPAVEALTRLGESYAPIFGPMRRVDRSEVARALAKDTDPELPQALPEDVLDIAEKLSHNLLREGKGTAAVAMWERHRARHESAKAAVGHARVLLELEHYQTALDVADQALVLAVDPSERDLAAIQDRAIRDGLSDALMVRAAAWSGLHHPAGAMVDLTVANQLQSETLDAVLEKRIRKEILPMKSAVQARYGGNEPAVRAVEKSRKLAGIDPKSAMDPLGDAFFLYCIPTQTDTTSFFALPWLADLAEAHALQAQIYNRLAMPDQARIAATLSTLLHNGVNARVWRDRAALHEEAGHIEAAFASWATARGLHADGAEAFDYDTALERTYDGPGSWGPKMARVGFACTEIDSWFRAVRRPLGEARRRRG